MACCQERSFRSGTGFLASRPGIHSAVSLLPEDAPYLLFVALEKKKSFQAGEIIKPG